MNDSTNQQSGTNPNQGQPQQGQSGDKSVQPNAPEHKDGKGQQEQKQNETGPKQDGDKSSSPS